MQLGSWKFIIFFSLQQLIVHGYCMNDIYKFVIYLFNFHQTGIYHHLAQKYSWQNLSLSCKNRKKIIVVDALLFFWYDSYIYINYIINE